MLFLEVAQQLEEDQVVIHMAVTQMTHGQTIGIGTIREGIEEMMMMTEGGEMMIEGEVEKMIEPEDKQT